MEAILFLDASAVGLVVFIGPIFSILGFVRSRELRRQVEDLTRTVNDLERRVGALSARAGEAALWAPLGTAVVELLVFTRRILKAEPPEPRR